MHTTPLYSTSSPHVYIVAARRHACKHTNLAWSGTRQSKRRY